MADPDDLAPFFKVGGVLRCKVDRCDGPQMYVELPDDFCDYARTLIPKAMKPNRPRHAPHITVVRKETVVIDPVSTEWKRWDGQNVIFYYHPCIAYDDTYAWHPVESADLIVVRKLLGLEETTQYTRPPDGNAPFHITVANFKRK